VPPQTLMAPFGTVLFFATMRAAEGSARDALPHALTKLRPALLANYSVWPFFHIVNFAFVPSAQRILFVNALSVSGGGGGCGVEC
jgi:protein Mpv17